MSFYGGNREADYSDKLVKTSYTGENEKKVLEIRALTFKYN